LTLDIGIYFFIVVISLEEHFPKVWQITPETLYVGKLKNTAINMKREAGTCEIKLVIYGV
jgi:hypothetical protein